MKYRRSKAAKKSGGREISVRRIEALLAESLMLRQRSAELIKYMHDFAERIIQLELDKLDVYQRVDGTYPPSASRSSHIRSSAHCRSWATR
jgi:hypothetical protein